MNVPPMKWRTSHLNRVHLQVGRVPSVELLRTLSANLPPSYHYFHPTGQLDSLPQPCYRRIWALLLLGLGIDEDRALRVDVTREMLVLKPRQKTKKRSAEEKGALV